MQSTKSIGYGFFFAIRGAKLLFKVPGALKWAIVPFLINIVLIATLMSAVVSFLPGQISALIGMVLGDPTGWLFTVLFNVAVAVVGVISTALVFYVCFLLSTVIASPFNSILAEKTLRYQNSLVEEKITFAQWVSITLKQLAISIVRALIFAVIGLFILIFSFVPILNILGGFLALLIVAFDSSDYSMEIKQMSLRDRFKFFKVHFTTFSGMALFMGLTLLIPGLSLLILPCAVMGASDVVGVLLKESKS